MSEERMTPEMRTVLWLAGIVVGGIVALGAIFGGQPDIADSFVCRRIQATAEQCIRFVMSGEQRTTTSTVSRTPFP